MKVKTSELKDAALDLMVARAQGREDIRVYSPSRPNDRGWIEVRFNPDPRVGASRFDPSDNWFIGGPIIEREKISVVRCNDLHFPKGNENGDYIEQYWKAELENLTADDDGYRYGKAFGPTPLIAAMRCYVASRLGDKVDVPEKLL